ncbi:uncharacterized protein [Watersipora subatra]|uniref:uncharacterized protein n=1 Tax=Watersipora subatra TaxID=2589382 RepID=UPI00355BCFC3
MSAWKNGLCSCFGNLPVCCLSYIVPCYVFGKVAEKNGESCLKCGLVSLVPIANIYCMAKQREVIRDKKGIDGTFFNDCLMSWCCPLCTLAQEAREIEADVPGIPEIQRE